MPGKFEESTEERKKSYELSTKIGAKKSHFQVGKNPKGRKLIEKKSKNDKEVKADGKEIQKAASCVFKKRPDSKRNEKTKTSDSERGKNSLGSKEKKKNKSWDHFRQTTSKAKKMSDVLEGAGKKVKTSDSELTTKRQEQAGSGTINKETNYKDNFNKNWSNEKLPEKSLSFQYLEFAKRAKELCKSLSLETGTDKQLDKREDIAEKFNGNFGYAPEAMLKHDQVHSTPKWRADSSELLNNSPGGSMQSKPDWKYTYKPSHVEIEKVKNKSGEILSNELSELEKEPPRKKWSNVASAKNDIKVCHCPHFHTEDGMKKICLQNNSTTEECGRKFFRVNYISKGKTNKTFIDKGTTTEEEATKKKSKVKADEEKKVNKVKKEKSKDDLHIVPKATMSFIKRNMHILEKTKKNKKKSGKETEEGMSVTKEVERLRQLFTKLNSVEHVLKKDKCFQNTKGILRNFPKTPSTDTKDKKQDSSKKKLKSKIVQHFHNWLDLEFNSS